jgi:hypothetical protein
MDARLNSAFAKIREERENAGAVTEIIDTKNTEG